MVAVVVPSPATSLVLEATSFTIWAPMFSYLSESSTSFATVTPSFVTSGEPNDFSMITFRPRGPSVTLTASVRMSTPILIAARASASNFSCFAIFPFLLCIVPFTAGWLFLLDHREDVLLRENQMLFAIDLYVPPPLLSVKEAVPTATTRPSCGFSFALSGMMIPPLVFVSSSTRLSSILSCNGLTFMVPPPLRNRIWDECLAAVSTQQGRVLTKTIPPGEIGVKRESKKRRNALQNGWLYFFLRHLLLEIFPVENIPFPPALGDLTGEFRDLLPDERVDLVLDPPIVPEDLFRLPERLRLVRGIRDVIPEQPVDHEVRQVGDPVLGQTHGTLL